jgi:hypothetical protein
LSRNFPSYVGLHDGGRVYAEGLIINVASGSAPFAWPKLVALSQSYKLSTSVQWLQIENIYLAPMPPATLDLYNRISVEQLCIAAEAFH